MHASPYARAARRRRAVLAAAVVPVLLAACTGGDGRDLPEAEEFAQGTCREAAPAVLALDEHARKALGDDVDRGQLRVALREEQERLQATSEGEGDVASALQDLVARVGFLRVAVDADALEPSEVQDVTAAVDDVVAVCVPGAASSG